MKNLLSKLFAKLLDHFSGFAKWLSDNVPKWLEPILKALGLGGLGVISLDALHSGFQSGLDRFGLFARLFQIDDVFDTINNAFTSSELSRVFNTDFIGICSSLGIVTAINEILNAMAYAVLVSILLFVVKVFLMGAVEIVKIANIKKV